MFSEVRMPRIITGFRKDGLGFIIRDILLKTSGLGITNNNNARPERKRAPIHRRAVVEYRIHCETQYCCKLASISRSQRTPRKIGKFTRAFAKILCFAGELHRQEFEISGFSRSRTACGGLYCRSVEGLRGRKG